MHIQTKLDQEYLLGGRGDESDDTSLQTNDSKFEH